MRIFCFLICRQFYYILTLKNDIPNKTKKKTLQLRQWFKRNDNNIKHTNKDSTVAENSILCPKNKWKMQLSTQKWIIDYKFVSINKYQLYFFGKLRSMTTLHVTQTDKMHFSWNHNNFHHKFYSTDFQIIFFFDLGKLAWIHECYLFN